MSGQKTEGLIPLHKPEGGMLWVNPGDVAAIECFRGHSKVYIRGAVAPVTVNENGQAAMAALRLRQLHRG